MGENGWDYFHTDMFQLAGDGPCHELHNCMSADENAIGEKQCYQMADHVCSYTD